MTFPMTPSRLLLQGSSALSAAAANGVDQLWKIQLRKEHRVLQDKIDALQMVGKDLQGQQENLGRLRSEFETKFENLEQTLRNRDGARDKETSSLRTQIDELQRNIITEDKIKALLAEQDRRKLVERPYHSEDRTCEDFHAPVSDSLSNSVAMSQIMEMVKETSVMEPQSKDIIVSTRRLSNKVTKRPVTRSVKKKLKKQPPAKPTTPLAQVANPTKFQELVQHSGSIGLYFANADKLHASLSITDEKRGTEFVNAFIQGLSSERDRDILVSELQQLHRSRSTVGGGIEVLCQWNDVEDALRTSALLDVDNHK